MANNIRDLPEPGTPADVAKFLRELSGVYYPKTADLRWARVVAALEDAAVEIEAIPAVLE